MTIEERFEKLTERHEALAQSVEILTADVREFTKASAKNQAAMMEAITRLAHIVGIHEERI